MEEIKALQRKKRVCIAAFVCVSVAWLAAAVSYIIFSIYNQTLYLYVFGSVMGISSILFALSLMLVLFYDKEIKEKMSQLSKKKKKKSRG